MKYTGTSWESSYKNAIRLFEGAKNFTDAKAKSRQLKQAWNAAYGLPDDYPGRESLMDKIESYAEGCGIDLNQVSGY